MPKSFMFMSLPAFAGGDLVVVFQTEKCIDRCQIALDCPGNLYLAESPGPKDWSPVERISKEWKLLGNVPVGLQTIVTVAYLNIEGHSVLAHHTYVTPKKHKLYFVPL